MGKEIVAMILAGGRGTRLKELTAKVAKTGSSLWGKISYHRLSTK